MMEELIGVSYFYHAVSEALLSKDLYHLYQVCANLIQSDYSKQALEVLQNIENRTVERELEILQEDVFLEGSYRELEKSHLYSAYERSGYQLEEGYKPDHLGTELKFLALLCVDGDLVNQYRFIQNRLGWLRDLKDKLKELPAPGLYSVIGLLEHFLRDHKSFLFSQLKQQSQEHQEDRN